MALQQTKDVQILALVLSFGAATITGLVESNTEPLNHLDSMKYKDCSHLHKAGYNVSGAHVLWMNASTSFLVRCEFTKDNAYTVIQRRIDGTTSFVQNLNSYISGFGNVQGNYWAGLNSINYLTSLQNNNVLTINMQDWAGNNQNARYSYFNVFPSTNRFQMTVSGFSGSVIDDFSYQSGMTFQTYDYPDQYNCSKNMRAGWWYNRCAIALLNGHYYIGGPYTPPGDYYDGIFWSDWRGMMSQTPNNFKLNTKRTDKDKYYLLTSNLQAPDALTVDEEVETVTKIIYKTSTKPSDMKGVMWWTEECSRAVKEKTMACRIWKTNHSKQN